MSTWDEADAHNRALLEAKKQQPQTGASNPFSPRPSRDRARTVRNEALIQRGLHPTGRLLLPERGDATCGDCRHLRVKEFAKKFFKCGLGPDTNGPATDLRKKWPACAKWEAAP